MLVKKTWHDTTWEMLKKKLNILTRRGPELCFAEKWIALNKNDPLNCFKITTTKTLTVVWSQNGNIMKILQTFGKYFKGINKRKGGWNSPKCRTCERWGRGVSFWHRRGRIHWALCKSAKDQGGTKLGNTHRHIMLVEKISQGRFPSCARLLVTSRSFQQQIVSFRKLMLLAWYKIHIRFWWCWLNKLWQCVMLILKPCYFFVVTLCSLRFLMLTTRTWCFTCCAYQPCQWHLMTKEKDTKRQKKRQ